MFVAPAFCVPSPCLDTISMSWTTRVSSLVLGFFVRLSYFLTVYLEIYVSITGGFCLCYWLVGSSI